MCVLSIKYKIFTFKFFTEVVFEWRILGELPLCIIYAHSNHFSENKTRRANKILKCTQQHFFAIFLGIFRF